MLSRKYVKDYRMDTTIDDRGRIREKMVYIGPLYRWDMSEGMLRRLKLRLLVVNIISWLLFFASLWRNSGIARVWYVIVPYCCLLFPLFYISTAIYSVLTAPVPFQRVNKDKTVDRVKRSCTAGMVLSLAAALGQITGWIRKAIVLTGPDIFLIAATWIICIFMLYGFIAVKRLKVQEIINPETAQWEDK